MLRKSFYVERQHHEENVEPGEIIKSLLILRKQESQNKEGAAFEINVWSKAKLYNGGGLRKWNKVNRPISFHNYSWGSVRLFVIAWLKITALKSKI